MASSPCRTRRTHHDRRFPRPRHEPERSHRVRYLGPERNSPFASIYHRWHLPSFLYRSISPLALPPWWARSAQARPRFSVSPPRPHSRAEQRAASRRRGRPLRRLSAFSACESGLPPACGSLGFARPMLAALRVPARSRPMANRHVRHSYQIGQRIRCVPAAHPGERLRRNNDDSLVRPDPRRSHLRATKTHGAEPKPNSTSRTLRARRSSLKPDFNPPVRDSDPEHRETQAPAGCHRQDKAGRVEMRHAFLVISLLVFLAGSSGRVENLTA